MSQTVPTPARRDDPNWSRRAIVAACILVGLALVWLVGAAFLPRWWAQRVGDQVGGSIASGTSVGLFYGFVFTLVPLVLLWLAFRIFESWKLRAGAVAVVLLLAAPNLLTLGIVLGTGSGSHAGDRILDVEAPGFRGATLAGALVAAALVAGACYLLASRRRAYRRADETRETSKPPPEASA
jgi:hypothetical protein